MNDRNTAVFRLVAFADTYFLPIAEGLRNVRRVGSAQSAYNFGELIECLGWLDLGVEIGHFPVTETRRLTEEWDGEIRQACARAIELGFVSGREHREQVVGWGQGRWASEPDSPSGPALSAQFEAVVSLAQSFSREPRTRAFSQFMAMGKDPQGPEEHRESAGETPEVNEASGFGFEDCLSAIRSIGSLPSLFERLDYGSPGAKASADVLRSRAAAILAWRLRLDQASVAERFFRSVGIAERELISEAGSTVVLRQQALRDPPLPFPLRVFLRTFQSFYFRRVMVRRAVSAWSSFIVDAGQNLLRWSDCSRRMGRRSMTVVIPTFNAAQEVEGQLGKLANVERAWASSHYFAEPSELKIVIADAGSQDNTVDVALRSLSSLGLHGRVQSGRFGDLSRLVMNELETVTREESGRLSSVVVMGVDDPVSALARLHEAISEGYGVAVLARTRHQAHRRALSFLLSRLARIPAVDDYSSGYVAFRAEALRTTFATWPWRRSTASGAAFYAETLLRVRQAHPTVLFTQMQETEVDTTLSGKVPRVAGWLSGTWTFRLFMTAFAAGRSTRTASDVSHSG